MRDESSMSRHTTWMSYITKSGLSCWFRIYNWLILFQQDNIMILKNNYFQFVCCKFLFTVHGWECTKTSKQRQNLFLPLFTGRECTRILTYARSDKQTKAECVLFWRRAFDKLPKLVPDLLLSIVTKIKTKMPNTSYIYLFSEFFIW